MTFFVSAQTTFHHCTFCASLHVKTSPATTATSITTINDCSCSTDQTSRPI